MTAFVEVNETAILMAGSHAAARWWLLYLDQAEKAGRVETVAVGIGDLVRISCADAPEADWLTSHMVNNGVPKSAVRANGPVPLKIRKASGRPRRFDDDGGAE